MNIVGGGGENLLRVPTFLSGIYRFLINHKLQNFGNLAECCGNVLGKFRDNPSCTKLKLNLRKYELNSGSKIEWNVDIFEK